MGLARPLRVVVAAAIAACVATPAAALASGPITSGLAAPASSRTLAPGVTLSQYSMKVTDHGRLRSIRVWKVAWMIGNPHVRLGSALLGSYYADDYSVRLGQISSWARWGAPSGLLAAINGDYFADSWRHPSGKPSGALVRDRRVYGFGWGGPGVGFKPGGDVVMGRPQVLPALLALPQSRTATIGSYGTLPLRGDQVGVYGGATVTIPAGGTGFVVGSTAPLTLLRGARPVVNAAGLGMSEPVAGFRFEVPGASFRTVSMALSAPPTCASGICPAGSQVKPPSGSVVLVAKSGGLAASALTQKVNAGSAIRLSLDDQGWQTVGDVMGGKPQLVTSGYAIAQRPSYVDDWQWSEPHWRPAVVKAANGTGWLAIEGGAGGVGVMADTWAKMLVQMGAKNAMGFDNNSSTELFRPGASPITAYGWERSIPSALALSYLR